MSVDIEKLVLALQQKREAKGLSLRALSSVIGVSFSTLARVERREGDPDNNSMIRILEWLGNEGSESGLSFEKVAFVHFRAAKNAQSQTIHCLLQAADALKRNYSSKLVKKPKPVENEQHPEPTTPNALTLSKPEMEAMALQLRKDVGLKETEKFEPLNIEIQGVSVFTPKEVSRLTNKSLDYLSEAGVNDWSAMSVPLDDSTNQWAILRNDMHGIERQRVTYLEECWHILLEHKLTKIAKVSDAYGRTYDSNEEHDAYYLAAASLLPEKAIIEAVAKKDSATTIAKKYGVSPELVEYRIKRLGLWLSHKDKKIEMKQQ